MEEVISIVYEQVFEGKIKPGDIYIRWDGKWETPDAVQACIGLVGKDILDGVIILRRKGVSKLKKVKPAIKKVVAKKVVVAKKAIKKAVKKAKAK